MKVLLLAFAVTALLALSTTATVSKFSSKDLLIAGFAPKGDALRVHADHSLGLEDLPVIMGVNGGVGFGFDVVTERVRAPLLRWNYDTNQIWNNPLNDRAAYKVPDELYVVNTNFNKVEKKTRFYADMSQVFTAKASMFGLNVGLGVGAANLELAFSRTKVQVSKLFKAGLRNFAMEDRVISLYELGLMSEDLAAFAANKIANLPGSCDTEDQLSQYFSFIRTFGTHYIQSVTMGGSLNLTSSFDVKLKDSYDFSFVQQQIGLTLTWGEIKLGIDSNRAKVTEQVNANFAAGSDLDFYAAGGDPTLITEAGGYTDWVATLKSAPGALVQRAQLLPIHNLESTTARRAALKKAVKSYIEKGGEL